VVGTEGAILARAGFSVGGPAGGETVLSVWRRRLGNGSSAPARHGRARPWPGWGVRGARGCCGSGPAQAPTAAAVRHGDLSLKPETAQGKVWLVAVVGAGRREM